MLRNSITGTDETGCPIFHRRCVSGGDVDLAVKRGLVVATVGEWDVELPILLVLFCCLCPDEPVGAICETATNLILWNRLELPAAGGRHFIERRFEILIANGSGEAEALCQKHRTLRFNERTAVDLAATVLASECEPGRLPCIPLIWPS